MKLYRKAFTLHGLTTGLLAVMTATLSPSCSNSITEPDLTPAVEVIESSESIVKFATIGEFESMTAADIPGDYAGNELKSLRYECVDTVELRALRFQVTAQLSDADGKSREVIFTAEVGPELVSVEYYPGGEMQEAHHNLVTAYYPKVERYRNYSDGSRIGPDLFYGMGHPAGLDQAHLSPNLNPDSEIMSWNDRLIEIWNDSEINPEYMYYENGWYCTHYKAQLEMNVNFTKIDVNGKKYSDEDLLPTKPSEFYDGWYEVYMARFESFKTDFYGINEYGHNRYRLSSKIPDEELEFANMCAGIKDISPRPFPSDSHNLQPGFYYGSDRGLEAPSRLTYYSIYDTNQPEDGLMRGFGRWISLSFYLDYLVIDGRIIHFNDIVNYKYLGRDVTVTHTPNGYDMHLVEKHSIFGYNMKLIDDFEIIRVNGPQILVDESEYGTIDENDNKELNSLNSQPSKSRSEGGQSAVIPRSDGNKTTIDRTLPQSIRSAYQSRTINL